jgi:hypothetical protein
MAGYGLDYRLTNLNVKNRTVVPQANVALVFRSTRACRRRQFLMSGLDIWLIVYYIVIHENW